MGGRSARRARALYALYFVVCTLALVWPGYAWLGARIEPFVLGLPFSFAWVVLWILATLVATALLHRALERAKRRERDR